MAIPLAFPSMSSVLRSAITVDRAPGLCQDEIATGADKQRGLQRLVEPANLAADRRLSQVQLLARLGHAPLARHDPEIQQVVIVQPFHPETPYIDFIDGS